MKYLKPEQFRNIIFDNSEEYTTDSGITCKLPYEYWWRPLKKPKRVYGDLTSRFVYIYYYDYIYADYLEYFIDILLDNNIEEWIQASIKACFYSKEENSNSYFDFENFIYEEKIEGEVRKFPSIYIYYKQEIPTLARGIFKKEIKGLISTIFDRNVLGVIDEFL